jgi:DNA damage-inducible protein 1
VLYVPLEVNGVKIQAFVDSGAQSTIMSTACAERCGIMRLVDKNFAGMAVGVGTAKIAGRVHLAPITIGGTTLNCTFTVMDKNLGDRNMEFLLGLDMLKRYQCVIDLKAPARLKMRAGGEEVSVQFLTEGELPESKGGRLPNDPTQGGEAGDGGEAKSESAAGGPSSPPLSSSAASSSSSSSASSAAAPAQAASAAPAPAPSAAAAAAPSAAAPSAAAPSAEEQLVAEGFAREAVQKALQDCGGNVTSARVVLKFSAARK